VSTEDWKPSGTRVDGLAHALSHPYWDICSSDTAAGGVIPAQTLQGRELPGLANRKPTFEARWHS
jgi:hypothetical protein